MEKNQKIEEALTIIWQEKESDSSGKDVIQKKIIQKVKEDILGDLIKEGYIIIERDSVKFSNKGKPVAEDLIRRQRLAERLFTDVLELGRKETDSLACDFEHILSSEAAEGICTLLGHPKECPHGHPIPRGSCCVKSKGLLESIVLPLTKLSIGQRGKIVYVLTRKHPQLHKLLSLGISPGVLISVHQVFPSFVIQAQETQVALEEDIAKEIYVKRL